MKKLIYVTTVFDPGAIPNILTDLQPYLTRAGWEAQVLTLQPLPEDRTALERAEAAGLRVKALGFRSRQVFQVIRALKKELRKEAPDLIHSHLGRADIFTALAKPEHVPLVTTFHSVRRNFPKSTLWGYWFTDRKTSHRTGVSQAAIDSMYADGFLRSPHSVIYNPVDPLRLLPQNTREEVRSRWGAEEGVKVILSVGRFVEAKGQIYLMEALPRIAAGFPGLKLVMAGSGPLEETLKAKARELGVEQMVRWEGFSSSVPDLFQGADLVVFPSLWEGMGLVPLEALLRSKPVAVSDLPALREFIEPGPAAEYFRPGDPEALAQAVVTLLNRDREAVTLDLLGRLPDLLGRFSAAAVAQQYLEVYEGLTGREE